MAQKMPKVVVIGGGSYTWSHMLLRDFFSMKRLDGSTIVLHDINARAARDVLHASRTLQKRAKSHFKVQCEGNLNRTLEGADFVVVTIQVGGLGQFMHEVNICSKYGTFQPVSGTTGPGMVPRTLVNAPVFLDIARRMERLCPRAWVLNFTNPVTTLTRVITRYTKIRAVGICHGIYGCVSMICRLLGVQDRSEIEITYGGVNHGSFVFDVFHKGVPVYDKLRQALRRDMSLRRKAESWIEVDSLGHMSGNLVRTELFDKLGYLTGCSDRHNSEFWPCFLRDGGTRFLVHPTSIERRIDGRPMDEAQMHDITAGRKKIPVELGHEPAAPIVDVMTFGGEFVCPVNVPNEGQIPNLPRDAIVECPGVISPQGIRPVFVGDMPAAVLGMTTTQMCMHDLAVEAAVEGSVGKALQAVCNDPLLRDWRSAKPIVLENVHAARRLLPAFKHVQVKRPGQAFSKSRKGDADFRALLKLEDRCLIDPTADLLKQVQAGTRWVNPGVLSREKTERSRARVRALDGPGKPLTSIAAAVEAIDAGEFHVWALLAAVTRGKEIELVFGASEHEHSTGGPPPFQNLYHRPALAITLDGDRAQVRWGAWFVRCCAFAALDGRDVPLAALTEWLATNARAPEAVRMAGRKAIRLFDVLSHDLNEWPSRIREVVKGDAAKRVLSRIGRADTDMALAEALAWSSTGSALSPRTRHALESLTGQVLFSMP